MLLHSGVTLLFFSPNSCAAFLGAEGWGNVGTLGTPTVCRAGWPAVTLVWWSNHLDHAWSIQWSFLSSPVMETPVLDVENLRLSAEQCCKSWLRQSVWILLQELFLCWTSTVVRWISWPVIFMLLLPGYIFAKNGSLWQCRSFFLSSLSTFVLRWAPSLM